MATLLVALSELYDDLAEFVRLRRTVGEWADYKCPSAGSVVSKGVGEHI